ncbi:hypothetical protein Patl1_10106 [Pistacia atlantica]|uniref:Uncharacterized protein n=1 Tax=Pistacia atlantica TaxID=434234 RepID=A0ACC1A3Q2_9ROSI|nr:hypothetical protein Patl1_10106 [Pistacia atlantica]
MTELMNTVVCNGTGEIMGTKFNQWNASTGIVTTVDDVGRCLKPKLPS